MALLIPLDGVAPQVHPAAFLAPTATLVGDVLVGADSGVFYGAVVRGDLASIWVGARTNLQDNVVVHADPGSPATIGDGVTVGHAAVVHGCTVEDGCLVGMGATIMNGAVIGAGSLVAAGALVLEGTQVPPRSLVAGVPAKVRRELTDDEVAALRDSATRYVTTSARNRAATGHL